MHKKNTSYIHPYKRIKYNINDAHEMYDTERLYYLTVNDSGYIPTYRSVIWKLRYKHLMPFMFENKEWYDAFMEYLNKSRNLRRTLKPIQKHYINLILLSWKKSYIIAEQEKILDKLKQYATDRKSGI